MKNYNILQDEDNYDKDDLIDFEFDSKTINLSYSQLVKYSKHVREKYVFSDIVNRLPKEIHECQEYSQLSTKNIFLFFKLLKQNYDVNGNLNLTYTDCIDLLTISNQFEVRKLKHEIHEYIKSQDNNVDFMIEMILHEMATGKTTTEKETSINADIEQFLSSKINECLNNEKFVNLPISNIFRIIEQSPKNEITSDKLFDFIKKSMSKLCVLFQFIEITTLSDDRFSELFESYSKSDKTHQWYFSFIKCDLKAINDMKEQTKSLENCLSKSEKEKIVIEKRMKKTDEQRKEEQSKNEDLEAKIAQLKKQLETSEKTKAQIEEEKNQIQKQLKTSEEEKKQTQKQLKTSEKTKAQIEEEKSQIQKQLKTSEEEKKDLQRRLEEELNNRIYCQVIVSAKGGLLINARIKIALKGTSLDTKRSKYIVSTSDAAKLGNKAYENGFPITSENMNTNDILCKPGKYYVRCIVYETGGQIKEFLSNSVTTAGSSISIGYEGKPTTFSLPRGRYKLEVWGSKGGDSTGKRSNNSSPGKGGLGGYSSGILRLNDGEVFHVFVGGEGCPSNSSEGSTTRGGFPDGGGTKTGHFINYTAVAGTGGGSTSIRIGGDTNYSRVIVAGGGGGASGSSADTCPGGFGGGLRGGNCYWNNALQIQGSGTQTGSTGGRGSISNGDPGEFGLGAAGKYCSGCDSGGGGGGGWYGGGSGGHRSYTGSGSGGGGSGWTFNETSFNAWKSGDTSNASKFLLSSSYYLSDAQCKSGEEEFPRPDGNGTERGHSGNGHAKITPIE